MQVHHDILIADDEANYRKDLTIELERQAYRVTQVENSVELRRIVQEKHFAVILLDLRMPDKDGTYSYIAGIENLKFLKKELRLENTAVIVVTGQHDTRLQKESMKFGAFDFLGKDDIARDRLPLLKAINGAIAELQAKAPDEDSSPREAIEVHCNLRFTVVPTGIYQQFGRGPFAEGLIQHSITNHGDEDVQVTLTTCIEKWSESQVLTIDVEAHRTERISTNPLIFFDRARKIRDVREACLQHSLTYSSNGSERVVQLEPESVWLHPVNTMCWALENPQTSRSRFLGAYIAAWVMPLAVQQMLRIASTYHPNEFIIGYKGGEMLGSAEKAALTRTQVRAMYEALRSHEIRVDTSSITYEGRGSQALQRVRLPAETLEGRVANCIDGSVVMASLIEAAGMHPVIVLVPGHAFVGWETWEGSGEFEYLETLLLNREPFEEALRQGTARFHQEQALKGFDARGSETVSIREARRAGIYPMFTR